MREGSGVLRSSSRLARELHIGESLQRRGAGIRKCETFKSVARSGCVAMKRFMGRVNNHSQRFLGLSKFCLAIGVAFRKGTRY